MWVRMRWCGLTAAAFVLFPAGPAVAQEWTWPEEPENLEILTAQQLRPVMRGFTRALGVRCSHCHVGEEGASLATYDFPSDEKQTKVTARVMLQMLGDINERLGTIEPSGDRAVNMWCHTCHRGRPRPMTIEEELGETLRAEGVEAAIARYDELKDRFYGRGAYDFGEAGLNNLGYELLGAGEVDLAVRIFQKNVEEFPESGNAHDSLGEAYMARGDTERAIASYEQSLELNPRNQNARDKLQELRSGS